MGNESFGLLGLGDLRTKRVLDPRCGVFMFTPTATDAPGASFNTGNPNTGSILGGMGAVGFWVWTLPEWVQICQVVMVGGGAGGCSGQRAAAGGSRSGGAGGGGAGSGMFTIPVKWIRNRRLMVSVGAGGAGGAAVSADTTMGNLGSNGGNTVIGVGNSVWHVAHGRAATAYATAANGSNFGAGWNSTPQVGRSSGGGGVGAAGATPPTFNANGSCGGGGGGAGISAANANFAGAWGSVGNNWFFGGPATDWNTGSAVIPTAGASGGGNGQSGWAAAGVVGNSLFELPLIGVGGAGGGSPGGAGGDGSFGGGGGGGGAGVNGSAASGAGGNGGPGLAVFLCWG